MKTFTNIIYALVGGLLTGVAASCLVLMAPCSWFGSSFEGACGYGALFTAIFVGLGATLTASTGILLYLTRRAPGHATPSPSSSKAVVAGWWVALAAQYLGFVPGVSIYLAGIVGSMISLVGSIVLVGLSAALARARGKHPAIALTALIPLIGPVITGVLLFKPASSQS